MRKILPLALLLPACAMVSSGHSGFLDDYTILEPNPDHADTVRWISPAAPDYDHVLVAPFVAYFHPNVSGKPIDANELDDLLTRLRGFLIDALTEDSLLATRPGPGVIRVEVAVTDLHERSGGASGLGLESANLEVRGTDSQTGALLFAAVVGPEAGALTGAGEGKWAAARALAKRWAVSVKQGLDTARGDQGLGLAAQ